MPEHAVVRGADPVVREHRGRILSCDFVVTVDDDDVARALEVLPFHVSQGVEPSRRHRIEVAKDRHGYRIREDGKSGEHASDASAAAQRVQERINALALLALDSHAKVHAGCATWQGRGLLVAGAARTGKSTLMARLLYEGFDVQGDDTVLLKDGRAMALPRRFGVRRGTLALIPQLWPEMPAWVADGPPNGYHVLALDPQELGFPWRIAPVPVDAVFFLKPAHGEPSRAVLCPRYRMANYLMSQSTPPAGGARAWIREISTLVARAECFVLEIGELDSAVRAMTDALVDVRRAEGSTEPNRGD